MSADPTDKPAPASQPPKGEPLKTTFTATPPPTHEEKALADMIRNAKTTEEKGIAAFSFLYDRFIRRIAERSENNRMDDTKLEEKRMYYDMVKWGVRHASLAALVVLVVLSVAVAWSAGDRELAKDILKFLMGGVAGYGIKAATSTSAAKD